MITISDGISWKDATDEQKISYCEALYEESKQDSLKRHFQWYLNHQFKEGNHYITYNSATNSLESAPRKKGEVRLVINKTKSGSRAIQNYATRNKPKWEVLPGDTDEDTIRKARIKGKVLEHLYRTKHYETIIDTGVDSSLDTSVAWFEPYWDKTAANGKGDVKVKAHNSFEIFTDKRAYMDEGLYKGRYLFKAISRSIQEIKNDKRYIEENRILVEPEDELAASEMQSRIIRKESGSSQNEKIPRAIVKEFQLFDEEKNEKGGRIQLFTYANGQILRDEPIEDQEFTLIMMQLPLDTRTIYHRPRTSDVVPLNKVLNRTISQKIMYVNKALVYRVIADKGHGLKHISNSMGEILEINPNRRFEQISMSGLPSTIDTLTNDIVRFTEDVQGAHEASLGSIPSGARSGKTIEALQAADSNNLSDVRKSLESFLPILGKRILSLISKHYTVSRLIKISDPEKDGQKYLKIIGEGANKKVKDQEDLLVIDEDNEIIVNIGSWLGHTREGQRETLLELSERGHIPTEEVLRQFEFPNIDDIAERARKQRLEEAEIQADIAGRRNGSEVQGQSPTTNTKTQRQIALADKENTEMMNGNPIPSTEGASPEHTQAHIDFMNSDTFQEADQNIQQIFAQHVEGEGY